NLGIIPGGGGTQRLTRPVGEGRAMELILTGEIINAHTAYNIGLVNAVVPAADLEAKTMELANRIAEKSPIALRMAKEAVKLATLIFGLAVAAWGGVIAYSALFLDPSATAIVNTGTGAVHEYPNMVRVTIGIILLVGGACVAFFAARRKPM